jgi:hypothetical protein
VSSGSCRTSSGGVVDLSKTDRSSCCSDDQAKVAVLKEEVMTKARKILPGTGD